MVVIVGGTSERGAGIAPGPPVGVGRHVVATGVDSHGIAVVLQPGLVHLLQVTEVINGLAGIISTGSQGAADHDSTGVFGLDGLVGSGQQLHVAASIQRLIAPLVVKVLLVPDLVGLHPALVALGHGRQEVRKVLRVGRRALNAEIGIPRPGPLRRFDHAEENLEAGRLATFHQTVYFTPQVLAFGWLVMLPLDLLLYPAETQVLDGVDNRSVILINEVRLDAVVETKTSEWLGLWFGGRCRLGHRSGRRRWWRSGSRHWCGGRG